MKKNQAVLSNGWTRVAFKVILNISVDKQGAFKVKSYFRGPGYNNIFGYANCVVFPDLSETLQPTAVSNINYVLVTQKGTLDCRIYINK